MRGSRNPWSEKLQEMKRQGGLDRDFAAGAAEPRRIEGGLLCSNKAINIVPVVQTVSRGPSQLGANDDPGPNIDLCVDRALFECTLVSCRPSHPNRPQSPDQPT